MNTVKKNCLAFLLISLFLTSCGEKTSTKLPEGTVESSSAVYETDFIDEQYLPVSSLHLSSQQDEQIKRIYQNYRNKFESVGRDRNISGYEKGIKKRELALKRKQEILNVLNAEQRKVAENWSGDVNEQNNFHLEYQLESLENTYKINKENLEINNLLSNDEKKIKKKELESQYKIDKEKLKSNKNFIKNSN